jgi:hypothetical protein
MLDGFGQAPVCLELDLDSYDGPWTHVERFRGRSGWLVVAEAEVTTAGAGWTTTLIAACDDYGEPVPHFMAPNLLACACSRPQPCREYPPDELDDLLEDAAHELRLGWLRENNAGLLNLSRAGAERVAALETATRVAIDEADRGIADLRRRRRMPGVSPHAISVFNEAITTIEVDREAALHRLTEQRAQVRRAIQEEELALLRRSSVGVTWEPLYHVSWSAAGRAGEDELAARDHVANARYRAGAFAHNERQGRQEDAIAATSLLIVQPRQAVKEGAVKVVSDRSPHGIDVGDVGSAAPVRPLPASHEPSSDGAGSTAGDPLEQHRKLIRRVTTLAAQVDALHSNRLAIGRGYLIRMVGLRREVATIVSGLDDADPASGVKRAMLSDAEQQLSRVETMLGNRRSGLAVPMPTSKPAVAAATPVTPITTVRPSPPPALIAPAVTTPVVTVVATPPPANAKLTFERDLLARQLVELETTGRKFLRGSPKFERNRRQRAELAERIRMLNAQLAEPSTGSATVEPSLMDQRAELEAELARHQKRGARPSDGANPYRQYRDRRLYLLGRIAELNTRIARQTAGKERA